MPHRLDLINNFPSVCTLWQTCTLHTPCTHEQKSYPKFERQWTEKILSVQRQLRLRSFVFLRTLYAYLWIGISHSVVSGRELHDGRLARLDGTVEHWIYSQSLRLSLAVSASIARWSVGARRITPWRDSCVKWNIILARRRLQPVLTEAFVQDALHHW